MKEEENLEDWKHKAYPDIPGVRLMRAVYGLCPDCDHERSEHSVQGDGGHHCRVCDPVEKIPQMDGDWAVCLCGNEPHMDGFYPCLPDGTEVEPDADGPWDGKLYRCAKCERIINQYTTS